jgi:alkanesulfonate monooxygenase SsuD/methylene tetrahydromethanopterin reductase-like flavin-dependent oxidoreductase (luciferase family)
VKVGLFFDLRNPPPWRRPWADHYARTLELIEGAERKGADAVWFSEHHFFEDGYLPQPLTFAAAVAARTSTVRIGTAVTIAALRHPMHLAEETAIVDILSNGRVDLGAGASYRIPYYETVGVAFDRRFGATDRAVAEVRRLLDEDVVTPPPLQRPFPIWLGYQGVQGAARAGRLGTGLLTLNRASLEPYRAALAEAGHDPATARMGGVIDMLVADDPEQTMAQVLPHYAYQQNTYRRYGVEGTGASEPRPISEDRLRQALAVVTPDDAVAAIRARTEGLPVEHVYLWASIAGMSDDLVERHIELLLDQVAPRLRAVEFPSSQATGV